MSILTSETVLGTIEFQNKTYELLSQPLSDEQFEKINQFKKENNCSISSASWSVNKYHWKVEDNKLYLINVHFKLCDDKSNQIKNIFDTDKLFASWLNKELKLLVGIDKNYQNLPKPREHKRNILLLNFSQGILISEKQIDEVYTSSRLKDYMDS